MKKKLNEYIGFIEKAKKKRKDKKYAQNDNVGEFVYVAKMIT